MSQAENIMQSINRAITAEEKQGCINTGAIGSFSGFLLEILSGSGNVFTPVSLEKMRVIVGCYSQSSPFKRRGLLTELKKILSSFEVDCSKEEVENIPEKTKESSRHNSGNETIINTPRKSSGSQSLQYIKGVGPQRAKQFESMGLYTVDDLIRHYPRRYEIRTKRKIKDLRDGEIATVTGRVTGSQLSRGRVRVVKLNIEQDGRSIHAIWFNQEYIIKQFPFGTEVSVTGKVQWNKRIPELLATEIIKGSMEGPEVDMVPVYPETARLNSKTIRSIMKKVISQVDKLFPEFMPEGEANLLKRPQAYREIHFPSTPDSMKAARAKLVVEEILFLQLALARLRSPCQSEKSSSLNCGGELVEQFLSRLPFKLTSAQKRVIQEIFRDMADGRKGMTRLIQGDVGSGKTVVAMSAILQAVGSGFQAAMMAPTEILAAQHFESLSDAFEPLGVKVALLVGNQGKAEREKILGEIIGGKVQVVVGTHALIQQTVQFNSLGLVVTDEQHRFGVRQRTLFQNKGENPHVLVMTATPIPRTLALTLYGDLQLSVLDEMPTGRKPIITKKISDRSRSSLEKFIEQQVSAGRQIYVVCPLVEDTEKSDLVSATQTAGDFEVRFPKCKVALLHGRMKGQKKENIMNCFRRGEIDILVATTVVEVGVNVPNATVMIVEEAQRFGLAQLHQLRGRVGRGVEQSYCFLISDVRDSARLSVLCETEDGFKIAEEDLKIRGPGELLGLRQHGVPELKLTDLTGDGMLIEEAYQLLQKALADPIRYEKLYGEVDRFYPMEMVGLN